MVIKMDHWDITKGKNEYVDSWPLMSSPGPMVSILAVYLLFVLKWGPTWMVKRNPFRLSKTLVLYNAIQVIFSVYLAFRYLRYNLKFGFIQSECKMNNKDIANEVTACIWWYFVAKISELLDTIFFVLRKKDNQVTFLHLYHHSIMMSGTWVCLKYAPSEHLVFLGFLNSAVHIVMYTYYGVAALGSEYAKYLWWKKYMTKVQLTQFCMMLTYLFATWYKSNCSTYKWTLFLAIFNVAVFLILFSNFYLNAYSESIRKKALKNKNYLKIRNMITDDNNNANWCVRQ